MTGIQTTFLTPLRKSVLALVQVLQKALCLTINSAMILLNRETINSNLLLLLGLYLKNGNGENQLARILAAPLDPAKNLKLQALLARDISLPLQSDVLLTRGRDK